MDQVFLKKYIIYIYNKIYNKKIILVKGYVSGNFVHFTIVNTEMVWYRISGYVAELGLYKRQLLSNRICYDFRNGNWS